jgi:cytidylate kinase
MFMTINGLPGTCRDQVALAYAEECNLPVVLVESVVHDIALGMGIQSDQLEVLARRNPAIDKRIRARTMDIAFSFRDVIISGNIACAYFPRAYNVLLVRRTNARIRSLSHTRKISEAQVLEDLIQQGLGFIDRYWEYNMSIADIDHADPDHKWFDRIIDSTHLSLSGVLSRMLE